MEHKDSKTQRISYIHPRDLDAGQPMFEGMPLVRRFKSYVGLKGAEKKRNPPYERKALLG